MTTPTFTPPLTDCISLHSLALTTTITPGDIWSRSDKPTPVSLSLHLHLPPATLTPSAVSDDVTQTISYGTLNKFVVAAIESKGGFSSLSDFGTFVCGAAWDLCRGRASAVELRAALPEALLLADAAGIEMVRADEGWRGVLFVDGLRVACVVGVNPHERLQKQWVVVGVRVWDVPEELWTAYPRVVKKVTDMIEASEYLTIETLALEVARIWVCEGAVETVSVAVEKPSALTFAKGSGVRITRDRAFFDKLDAEKKE